MTHTQKRTKFKTNDEKLCAKNLLFVVNGNAESVDYKRRSRETTCLDYLMCVQCIAKVGKFYCLFIKKKKIVLMK